MREALLKDWLDENEKSTIWSNALIQNQDSDLSLLYRSGDGHPTTELNQIIADAITNVVISTQNTKP